MPFKRKLPARKRPTTQAIVARQVNTILKKQVEVKTHTTLEDERAVNDLSDAHTIYALNNMTTSSGVNARIGNQVTGKGCDLRYCLHNNSGVAMYARVLLLRASGDPVGNYDINEIFRNSTGSAVNRTGRPMDMVRQINKSKFTPIYDRVHVFGTSAVNDGSNCKFSHKYVDLKNQMCKWSTESDIPEKGQLYLCVLPSRADGDAATASTIELSFVANYYFTDM